MSRGSFICPLPFTEVKLCVSVDRKTKRSRGGVLLVGDGPGGGHLGSGCGRGFGLLQDERCFRRSVEAQK